MPNGDPFEYYGERNGHPGVTAGSIKAGTEDPATAAAQLTQIGQDLNADSKRIDIDVDGDLVDALKKPPLTQSAAAFELARTGGYAVAAMTQFADAVGTFDTSVTALNREAEEKIRHYTSAPYGPFFQDKVPAPMTAIEARAQAKSDLEGRYQKLLKPLNAAIETVTNKLHNYNSANIKSLILAGYLPVGTALMYGVPLTRSEYYMAEAARIELEMAGMTTRQKVDHLTADPVAPGVMDIVLKNDPAIAKEAVNRASSISEELIAGTTSPKELPRLNSLLSAFGNSLAFASPFVNGLGPGKLMQLNLQIARFTADDAPGSYVNPRGGPRDDAMAALIKTFQENLSVTLGTATGGPDGYPARTPPEFRLRSGFMSELYAAGGSKVRLPGMDGDSGPQVYGYQALAPLLSTGRFDSEFLSDVGSRIFSFEKAHGGIEVWRHAYEASGISTNGLRLDWTHGTGSRHPAGWDPLVGLMKGYANNPEASHRFFTADRAGGDDEVLGYLLNERRWGLNGVDTPWSALGVDEHGNVDKKLFYRENDRHYMDSFGEALAAATGIPDKKAALLFADIVDQVATGGHWKGDRFEDIRDSFADMATQHIGAINSALAGRGEGLGGDINGILPGIQFNPGMSADDANLLKFLNGIGRDPQAKNHLVTAEAIYVQAGYEHFINNSTLPLVDRIRNLEPQIVGPMGKLFGVMDWGAAQQAVADGAEDDRSHNDRADAKYDFIGFVADQIPLGKVPVGGDLASRGVDSLLAALQESRHVDTRDITQALVGDSLMEAESKIRSNAEASLFAHLSDEGKVEIFGGNVPMDEDGTPKAMSQWTKKDIQLFETVLANQNSRGGFIASHGERAVDTYQDGYELGTLVMKEAAKS